MHQGLRPRSLTLTLRALGALLLLYLAVRAGAVAGRGLGCPGVVPQRALGRAAESTNSRALVDARVWSRRAGAF